jgi:hypothetical protein
MHVAARPYVMAGAVVAAASLVAVTPPLQVATEAAQRAGQFLDFQHPVQPLPGHRQYPANGVDTVTYAAQSLFNSGPRFVVRATNLWDVDPRRRLGRPGNGVRSCSDGGRLDDHVMGKRFRAIHLSGAKTIDYALNFT